MYLYAHDRKSFLSPVVLSASVLFSEGWSGQVMVLSGRPTNLDSSRTSILCLQ